jgi:carboxyl-terminal processing protease
MAEDKVPIQDLQNFTDTINYIKFNYVKDIEDSELFDNAIRGMLTSLDPHSNFLDEEEFKEMMVSTNGQFGGIGLEVTTDHGLVKVISPIDDTPAQKAGIKPGDYIVKIDDKLVHGLSLKDAVKIMRGKAGSPVTLVILRKKADAPIKMTLKREIINVVSVKSKMLLDEYAYIKVSQFQQSTAGDLATALKDLYAKNKNIQGIILDLRNNPGGTLDSAVAVADSFLDKEKEKNNLIVYTQGKNTFAQTKETIKSKDLSNGLPMVVLVNEGSASGSEIVAGALQDHKRAIIVGTTTFGKGSVQTLIPLQKNRGIKLTTALYYTPSGRSIQATGIEPDIYIKQLEIQKDKNDNALEAISESQLSKFIKNGQNNKQSKQEKQELKTAALLDDYQLYQAVNILQTLKLSMR